MCGEEVACVVQEIDGRCGGFVVAGLGVRQPCVAVDRGMQVGVADARLLVLRFPALGSFGLVGTAAVGTPTAAVRDLPDLLDVPVHHLTESSRDDDLRFSVVLAVRVDEPAAVQSQVPQDFRDRPTSNNGSIHSEFERDS